MRNPYIALLMAFAAGVSSLTTGCSTLEVHSDHDPRAAFGSYRTYAWEMASGSVAADLSGVPSAFMDQRIRESVDEQLARKGLARVEPREHPDVRVSYRSAQRERLRSAGTVGFGMGYGYGSRMGAVGLPAGGVDSYTQGTIVIDIMDARNDALVWRGIASDVVADPDESRLKIREAVAKTFELYPPTATGSG